MNSLYFQEYLYKVIERLKQQHFHFKNDIKYKNQKFKYVAKRTRFEIGRFGLFSTFFLFAIFEKPDILVLGDFSSKSFKYAQKTSGIHPPGGLFYGMAAFPVAIVSSIDENTAETIRRKEPPRHWAATEKLMVFSLESKALYYCEETFKWGYFYYDCDRIFVNEILSP